MSLFSGPDEHAANPPETWRAVKVAGRCWHLDTAGGVTLGGRYETRRAAEADKVSGFYVRLYEEERRWYAGEPVTGWRPYADIVAERERRRQRQLQRSAAPQ
jgi:hypothetical protein